MKPKLSVVFSQITDKDIADITVERMYLSKARREMRIVFGEDTTVEQQQKAEERIREHLKLRSVSSQVLSRYSAPSRNVIVYNIDPEKAKKMSESEDIHPEEYGDSVNVVDMLIGRAIKGRTVPIKSLKPESGRVIIRGKIFSFDEREIHSKKKDKKFHLVTMNITDMTDSITLKMFVPVDEEDPEKEEKFTRFAAKVKKGVKGGGIYVVARGKAQFDDYMQECVVMARDIAEVNAPAIRMDNAPVKRVELHMHTQMSQMDAVSSTKDLIDRAVKWGHKAIAITDHGVVQSYPDAMHASDDNEKIKVLYGVEAYLLDDGMKVIYDTDKAKETGFDSEFVVFDIETTGLDNKKCKIIEIGAVKIKNGEVIDRFSKFIDPEIKIPKEITDLTGISDNMVAGAGKIEEIFPEFKEFCRDCIVVAHNALFDVGFMKEKAKELGDDFDFCYMDTLTLGRAMYPGLNNHKLDTIAKFLGVILENHHRAIDDATATGDVFIKMVKELQAMGEEDATLLNDRFSMARTAHNSTKRPGATYHIILLAKNLEGIRHIYELVSQSHLSYFYRVPRIPRSLLEEKRGGLIVGSACEAGELMHGIVRGKTDEELEETVNFYDYLEIQPIGNNAYMKRSDRKEHKFINTDEDLRDLNRRVVALGEKYNKPVCATCDVHFLDMDGAEYRKIIMHYKGFKDADDQAPLYLRTTEEMLEEFAYLGKEKAYEVVVTNTNMIADMIEPVRPIPKKKCPPVVEGAKEAIVNDSYAKARAIYGDPLPEIVQSQLDKELNSITTYGFSVMYRIAQELVRKSLSDGYLVGSRGSVGSSFVAFLSDITEVNSLPAHYICPKCKYSEFIKSEIGVSGCDLPPKKCPQCGEELNRDGHDIPFETFLGFKGDKEPDIDLNFSGEYQPVIHKYTETFFGEGFVFRAGTIGTVAEKTAYGYVLKYCEEKGIEMRGAEKARLAQGCVGVKRTSGQHPGGIIVVPYTNNIHEFCPIQHPADDPESNIFTTHFDYHSIDANLLKLDELGHDDPTVIRMLEDITGIDAKTIPLGDPETLSLFRSTKALNLLPGKDIGSTLGTYGIPEFGTKFVQKMLTDTKPSTFSELVRISGLSHGTDVWLGNAQELIQQEICDLSHTICCRDDIMVYLIAAGVEAGHAFKIMESVRKGKGLTADDETAMRAAGVPDWYIDSCKKIKYMFPKAHAVAYVTMALRIAYCKVHHPVAFYIAYFSVRADDFDASIMAKGEDVARAALEEIYRKKKDNTVTPKEENLIPIIEICIEMYARGYTFEKISLYDSHATDFLQTENGILPPLNAFPGVGTNAAKAITEARANGPFKTVADLRARTGIGRSICDILEDYGCFEDLPEQDQVSLFEF